MGREYIISFEEDITSFNFYNITLSKLHEYFSKQQSEELVLDFSHVEYISPLTIPYILTVGVILKNHFRRPVAAYIPWKKPLISYLHGIGFIKICKQLNVFNLDYDMLEDLDYNVVSKESISFYIPPHTALSDVHYQVQDGMGVISRIFRGLPNSDYMSSRLAKILTEVCHNASSHSGNIAFATFQSNISSSLKHKKAYICISDCGIGLSSSIRSKIMNNDYVPYICDRSQFLKSSEHLNLLSILEAILYRSDNNIYGLYSVLIDILTINGIVRVHSDDTQIIFTKSNFLEYLDNPEDLLPFFQKKIKQTSLGKLDVKYSPTRKTDVRFKGVHIEIEVPLN